MVDAEQIAREALVGFGLHSAELTVVKTTNNAVFHVQAGNERFALRVHRPGYRKLAWIEGELTWLDAICAETDLCVPKPAAPVYHSRVGEETVYCTLLTWLDGAQVPPAETTPELAFQIGRFIGRLHEHSARLNLPSATLPHLDLAERLTDFAAAATIGKGLLTMDERRILMSFVDEFRIVINPQNKTAHHKNRLHGDLIWKNVLTTQNTICAIDFDDCAYGHYLYDLAPLLLGYQDEAHYPELKHAIWAGYTSIRPQPAEHKTHLEALVAARHALSIKWIAENHNNPAIGNRARPIIQARIQELEQYLKTGEFRRGEIIV